ncbi:uncharacterized protein CPAR2_205450 [Candida parapsilosis]|uniref:GCR1_C domain-containing protein n=1 Tax=Candida parapsilosis (strain CDC 317 / ATCC MYA-4646) TaxID=578454 RepID=G8BGB8_CANPC|nr:uncharacterized protein CPAR2_205450 [Candida parapsilosis]CCE42902.1 hypothetical protein CPAR2_205450 [Candida parapsilosis]
MDDLDKEDRGNTSTDPTSNFITDQELENVTQSSSCVQPCKKQTETTCPQHQTNLESLSLNQVSAPLIAVTTVAATAAAAKTTTATAATATATTATATTATATTATSSAQPDAKTNQLLPTTSFTFRNPIISEAEQTLLNKFETEVMTNKDVQASLEKLKIETKDKYLYQIRRYIRFCANKGQSNFYVTTQLAQEMIANEAVKKRGVVVSHNLTENTIRSIRSPLNKLYFMNKIVYGDQQQNELLGEQFIQHMIGSVTQKEKPGNDDEDKDRSGVENKDDRHKKEKNQVVEDEAVDCESNLKAQMADKANRDSSSISSIVLTLNTDSVTSASSKSFGLSGNSKHRLSESEESLLRKFDQEILANPKTQEILSNLTGNTFKSYATDIKRFIRYCARKGKKDFLIDDDILTRFLSFQTSKGTANSGSSNRRYSLRNTRTSLLKLHQLNCLAYDLEFSEGDIVLTLNKFLDATDNATDTLQQLQVSQSEAIHDLGSEDDPLLVKLQQYYKSSTVLDGLSDQSRKLYANEFNRYALFCSQRGLQHFYLTGDLIKQYFVKEVIAHTPTISAKKLKEILSRLNRLHNLNIEIDPANTPKQVENIQVVKDFLNDYTSKSHSDSLAQGSSSGGGNSGRGGPLGTNTSAIGGDGNGASSSSTIGSGSGSGNGNGADTLSGASTSGLSVSSGLPQLHFTNNPTAVLSGSSSSLSSEQPSGGELSSLLKKPSSSQTPKSRLKSSFQSYSSRSEIIDTTRGGGNSSGEVGGDVKENTGSYGIGRDLVVSSSQQMLQMVDEKSQIDNVYESIASEEDDIDYSESEPKPMTSILKRGLNRDSQEPKDTHDLPRSSQVSSSASKRQKLEILPETNDSVPKFVMNQGIESITQLLEEWTLIIKRNGKYGLAWIKTANDLQLYNNRKLIISLMEEVIPTMNENHKGKKLEEIYLLGGDAGESDLFELALVFDEYLHRKNLTIDDLIKKIENYPSYVKREFLRILSRRKRTAASAAAATGVGGVTSFGTYSSSSSQPSSNIPPP